MPSTATETITQPLQTLSLRSEPKPAAAAVREAAATEQDDASYKYKRFLPSFDQDFKLPPLEPFEHVDPGKLLLGEAPLEVRSDADTSSTFAT